MEILDFARSMRGNSTPTLDLSISDHFREVKIE